jgi:hypothetical protein
MWRYTLSAIVALGLIAVGIVSFARGQVAIGTAFVAIAVLRLATVLLSRKPRKPEPSIRLNIDGEHSVQPPHDSETSNGAHKP